VISACWHHPSIFQCWCPPPLWSCTFPKAGNGLRTCTKYSPPLNRTIWPDQDKARIQIPRAGGTLIPWEKGINMHRTYAMCDTSLAWDVGPRQKPNHLAQYAETTNLTRSTPKSMPKFKNFLMTDIHFAHLYHPNLLLLLPFHVLLVPRPLPLCYFILFSFFFNFKWGITRSPFSVFSSGFPSAPSLQPMYRDQILPTHSYKASDLASR